MSDLFELAEPKSEVIIRAADISPCGTWRYRLTRQWAAGPMLPFIMLNPSTADASIDDPTIRRCMGFARREGMSGIVVGNLYAQRATNPSDLLGMEHAYGPKNGDALLALADDALLANLKVVCAWGASERARDNAWRAKSVMKGSGVRMVCLGKTASGAPRHPLYVKGDQPFEDFE